MDLRAVICSLVERLSMRLSRTGGKREGAGSRIYSIVEQRGASQDSSRETAVAISFPSGRLSKACKLVLYSSPYCNFFFVVHDIVLVNYDMHLMFLNNCIWCQGYSTAPCFFFFFPKRLCVSQCMKEPCQMRRAGWNLL